jgi:hypothetical protein
LQHFDALLKRGDGPIQLMRGSRGRDEPHLVEPGLLAALLGRDQMGQVNGVKRASQDAHAHGEFTF